MKICHLTSVHGSQDVRIFWKECVSLAQEGYETYLIAYGESMQVNGVSIIGLGERETSRLKRITSGARRVYEEALKLDADLYHFHDPELLPYGKKLKKKGKIVIYDSHEDVPRQIMAKDWIHRSLRKIVSALYEKYELLIVKKLDCLIAATPHIANRFANLNIHVDYVRNFPVVEDIAMDNADYYERKNIACYAGGITEQRGILEIILAMGKCNGKLILAGVVEEEFAEKIKQCKGYDKTKFVGFLNRKQINELYYESRIGLCVLRNTPNHVNALAIKLFEYMAAGIPIICSNFPLWVDVVENNECGICVDPENIDEIAEKMEYLFTHPDIAKRMGDNGKKIVSEKFNWNNEKERLFEQYRLLLKGERQNGIPSV